MLYRTPRSVVPAVAWVVATAVISFTAENLWLDQWLQHRWPHLPALAPEPLSSAWLFALALLGIFCGLLVACQILVMRDRTMSGIQKLGTGVASVSALLLCGLWFHVATEDSLATSVRSNRGGHTVTLTWDASASVVDGYIVYRGLSHGGPYVRISKELVRGLSFVDREVENGVKYYYVVRAVDSRRNESRDSNEAFAAVPQK